MWEVNVKLEVRVHQCNSLTSLDGAEPYFLNKSVLSTDSVAIVWTVSGLASNKVCVRGQAEFHKWGV